MQVLKYNAIFVQLQIFHHSLRTVAGAHVTSTDKLLSCSRRITVYACARSLQGYRLVTCSVTHILQPNINYYYNVRQLRMLVSNGGNFERERLCKEVALRLVQASIRIQDYNGFAAARPCNLRRYRWHNSLPASTWSSCFTQKLYKVNNSNYSFSRCS